MRASGSNDLLFEDCFVPEGMLSLRGSWGDFDDPPNPLVAMGLTAAFLGIAEAAHALAIGMVTGSRSRLSGRAPSERASIQHTVAAMEIDLAAARAIFERAGRRADTFLAEHPPPSPRPRSGTRSTRTVSAPSGSSIAKRSRSSTVR